MASLPSAGSIFADKLRIDAVLGRGAMGIVYGATDLTLGRRVALKVIAPEALDDDQRMRFEREARAAAALRSEHAVRIHEAGSNPMPYLVMEYLDGTNLEDHLEAHGALPVAQAVGYVLEALDAIAEAHRAGFVHRDLKPANLFLDRSRAEPMVKVLDFGLVRTTEPTGTPITAAGATMGTPLYMAPEQVDAKPAGAPADVWSLGVTLYELLTGHTPFEAPTTMGILTRILREPPIPVQQWRPDVPPELAAILERCLAKRPEDRFASGAELAAALAGPGTAHTGTEAPAVRPPSRKHRVGPSILAAAAAMLVVIGIAGLLVLAMHRGAREERKDPAPVASAPVASAPVASAPVASASAVPIDEAPPTPIPIAAPLPVAPSATRTAVASTAPARRPETAFGSMRGDGRVHGVHVERLGGFEDEARYEAWQAGVHPRLVSCARQLLCPGVLVVVSADGTGGYTNLQPRPSAPPGCVLEDSSNMAGCFKTAIEQTKPPVACKTTNNGRCMGHVSVHVD